MSLKRIVFASLRTYSIKLWHCKQAYAASLKVFHAHRDAQKSGLQPNAAPSLPLIKLLVNLQLGLGLVKPSRRFWLEATFFSKQGKQQKPRIFERFLCAKFLVQEKRRMIRGKLSQADLMLSAGWAARRHAHNRWQPRGCLALACTCTAHGRPTLVQFYLFESSGKSVPTPRLQLQRSSLVRKPFQHGDA